ncbi:5-formyltetrahydrofolate cyclo-ligase-like isoform X3 [Acropora millepora]|uniref:5-formyltetrahydrofolate cyclo-ligase-like isoform X3 n=1 Tax=Acropora millepora TaxID=45264 RepID=UPI001CF45BCA|nr:5-formyltetrahydrofolate cyclo-ligase-like isoform X3 [Acropora millepora]
MNPVAINEAKKVLRREIKKRITTMSDELKLKESISIVNELIGMEEYKLSRRISVYLSMPSEVQTEGILKDIFQTKKDCFVPCYIGSNMDMVKLDSMKDFFSLPLTSWNIRQPAEDDEREEALLSGGLDLIVVPGLGFTKHGLRLGRGKGYYDSYIKKCTDKCEKKPYLVGLAFSTQICDDLPVTERDMVWALRRSPFRDQRREVAKMCGASMLEIFHPYSVENLHDNINLWWLQDKSHLLDLKTRKLYMK